MSTLSAGIERTRDSFTWEVSRESAAGFAQRARWREKVLSGGDPESADHRTRQINQEVRYSLSARESELPVVLCSSGNPCLSSVRGREITLAVKVCSRV